MSARTRLVILAAALVLAACASFRPPPALPMHGPILYRCSDGTQLTAEFKANEARVAIVGGYAMVLPHTGGPDSANYDNGRYGINGGGRQATWRAAGRQPVSCTGQ
jgi:hypothetical protein